MRLEVITAMVTQVDTEKLRRIRTQAKLTQGDVAKALGYKTPLGYHYIESGRCRLRADQLFILADLLGVEADELMIVRPVTPPRACARPDAAWTRYQSERHSPARVCEAAKPNGDQPKP